MIEIGLALAGAKKAVDLIKAGVENYEDISDLVGKLGGFYDAKEKIEEAKVEHHRNPNGSYSEGSVEQYALKLVEAELKIAKYEEQVKKIFMAKGKTPLYQKMMRIREEERFRRTQEKIKQNRIKREKLKKEQDFKNLIFALFAAVFCIGGGGFIVTFLVSIFQN